MIFAGKKVLVFGTGKSGIAAEELLHKKGASVVLYDGNDKLEKEEIIKKLESRDSVEVVLGELPEEMLDSLDLVVLSPGGPKEDYTRRLLDAIPNRRTSLRKRIKIAPTAQWPTGSDKKAAPPAEKEE